MTNNPKLIVGISGASGIIYGIRILTLLKNLPYETHLVVSKSALLTCQQETEFNLDQLKALADVYHTYQNIGASIASGSFKTMGMIIAPCSMKTLGEIAHGIGSNLLSRAADVVLKERRRLVLLPRESPLQLNHLQNMLQITQMGGIICPPVPAFYNHPQTIMDIVDNTVLRALDLFNIDCGLLKRWGEN